MVIEYFTPHKDRNLFTFIPPKVAPGRKDWHCHCDNYTHTWKRWISFL